MMWRVPTARVPNPTQEQLDEIMMTKGGKSFVYKRFNDKMYDVGWKKKPSSTEVRSNDKNKDMLKYTYVRDGEGLWTRIECAQMLSCMTRPMGT